ncbi:hypothetical protein [Yoonia sp.]|uniref:hypothetical protein n=1 Tax=Yoonia sp. TaxID=2212373 RepID=UPI0019DF018C|nr:hypothetical protein [Yoonia sp.]MBE0412429.1 hypothetical protein [Yoonia sp.]
MIGLELTPSQLQRGNPAPLAEYFSRSGGQAVAIGAAPGGGLSVWTEIAPHVAACLRLDNTVSGTRLSWRETLIATLRNIYPAGDLTLTGSWVQMQSSGSGLAGSYTGNRAVSTTSAQAQASVLVGRDAPYDLWVHYTGRVAGAYCRVAIDGTQTLVNEIDDPAGLGFKAFSTHSAIDLHRRRSVKVASGLTGQHTVTLQHGGAAHPGGSTLMIEAVAISGSLSDPRILPPVWQAGHTYTIGDEVQYGGVYYAARATGISGAHPPAHTAGVGSDGALDWRADTRSTYPRFVCIDYPSEREYAIRCAVDGVTTEIGGQTHGNEALQNRSVMLDGAPFLARTTGNGLRVGAHVTITETTIWQTSSGPLADCTLIRQITPGTVAHDVTVTATGPVASVDWLYIGMVPMVRWDGKSGTTVFDTVAVGDAPAVILADFAGQTPPNIMHPAARSVGMSASLDDIVLRYGLSAGALPITDNLVNRIDTFLRPNLEATTEGGSLDWKAKAYVTGGAPGGLTFGAGDVLGFFSRHVFGTI